MLAVFRCDASPEIGGGHVMRCLSLALKLKETGWNCGFAFRDGTLETVPALNDFGFELLRLDCPDEAEPLKMGEYWRNGCNLLVVDHYGRSYEFEKACRDFAGTILVIDDLNDRQHHCDMLLDQNMGKLPKDYIRLVPEGCKLLLGPKYALLRPEFAEMRPDSLQRRTRTHAIERILVSFGAGNSEDAVGLTLRSIRRVDPDLSIDVVLGNVAAYNGDVEEIIGQMSRVRLHRNIVDIATLMSRADIAFGAPGGTAWERCCLGLPTMLVVLAENQERNALELERYKAALNLGWFSDLDDELVSKEFRLLLEDLETVSELSRNSASLCDGRGATRLCMYMIPPELGKDGGAIQLRFADGEDMRLIYDWQTDPRTRQHARKPEIPTFSEHRAWFESKLDDPRCFLLMVLHRGQPSGVLRFDRLAKVKEYEISIYVSPDKYRKGIAKAALAMARRLWPNFDFRAEVLNGNIASQELFLGAGYERRTKNLYVSPSVAKREFS